MEPPRRAAYRRVRLFVRDCFVTIDRRDRVLIQSDFRNDGRDATFDLSYFFDRGLDRSALFRDRALHRRHRLYRCVQRRYDLAGFEDRFPGWLDTEIPANRYLVWRARFCARAWSNSAKGQRRLHGLCARRET